MIQFNLLPDVKLQYIKARHMKRIISIVASLCIVGSLALTALLFVLIGVVQTKYLNDLSADINKTSSHIKGTKDLDKILTIQNQLQSLPALHDKKPVASRAFGYLSQVTPAKVNIATMKIDFTNNTIDFSGSADSLATVNQFVDTLKFTNYQKDKEETKSPAFSEVVLASFGRDDKGASYSIKLKFDPVIFDGTVDTKLVVPKQITTRSETEKPEFLFQPLSNSSTEAPKENR
jgi:Tfp pilus assembly protein PilN